MVERDADAEDLVRHVKIDDARLIWDVHFRRKIFTAEGVRKHATVRVEYSQDARLENLRARTVLPDGSVRELDARAAFDDVPVRTEAGELRRRSWVMPGITPGAIIEVRYTLELRHRRLFFGLPFQAEVPARRVSFEVVPAALFGMETAYHSFGVAPEVEQRLKDGALLLRARGVQAFRAEPWMPPEAEVRGWVLFYYRPGRSVGPALDPSYWSRVGRAEAIAFERRTRPNGRLRQTAAAILLGTESHPARVESLFTYCRDRLRVLGSSDPESLRAAGARGGQDPVTVLRLRVGTQDEVNETFAALARAAGFEVAPLRLSSKRWLSFRPDLADEVLLLERQVAVRVGEGWLTFDAGNRLLPSDMIPWDEEGVLALVCGRDSSWFVRTPCAAPGRSRVLRTADLECSPDGSLSGTVRLEVTGHLAAEVRERVHSLDTLALLDRLRERLRLAVEDEDWKRARLGAAAAPWAPLIVEFPWHLPGPTTPPTQSLILEPAHLVGAHPPVLEGLVRRHPIAFPFAWREDDRVRIRLPRGWKPAGLPDPRPVEAVGFARHEILFGYDELLSVLVVTRAFEAGVGGTLYFPAASFAALREYFGMVEVADRSPVRIAVMAPP